MMVMKIAGNARTIPTSTILFVKEKKEEICTFSDVNKGVDTFI